MKTVVLGPPPVEVEQLIERRKRLGVDGYDEVWEGTYHMAPMARVGHGRLQAQMMALLEPLAHQAGLLVSGPFNLGRPDDFRVPDAGLHRGDPDPEAVCLDRAAVVLEVRSPGDETYEKLPFYAAHEVDEVLVVDPSPRRVHLLMLEAGGYREVEVSALLGVQASDLEAAISWP